MLKVRDGDLDKLGLLFERYKKPLFGFFFGMNKDRDVSEDLVQNVFYRILRYRNLFRGDGEFKTWMFHIARNVSHDHFRKNKTANRSESIEGWQYRLGMDENRHAEIEHEEKLSQLMIALDRLPEEKREVLLLSRYQEKKYKEIGEILGCSEGAVKVKVFRALQDLRSIFNELENSM